MLSTPQSATPEVISINERNMAVPILHPSAGGRQIVNAARQGFAGPLVTEVIPAVYPQVLCILIGNQRRILTESTPKARFLLTAMRSGELIVTSQLGYSVDTPQVIVPSTPYLKAYGLAIELGDVHRDAGMADLLAAHQERSTQFEAASEGALGSTGPVETTVRHCSQFMTWLHWLPDLADFNEGGGAVFVPSDGL